MLDTEGFRDSEAICAGGGNLGTREEHRKPEARAQLGRGSKNRQCREQQGNGACLTVHTSWRQVIYKSNFRLTTEPWSIATLIDVSAT